MKKLSVPNALIVFATLLSLHNYAAADISEQRGEEIIYTVRQDCGSCHGLTLAGGLGPDLKAKRLQALPDTYLTKVIKEGIPNTPMPPWQAFFNDEEIQWIVMHLKRGTL